MCFSLCVNKEQSSVAQKSCTDDTNCIDDGSTCHMCVNQGWLAQNPDWSIKHACTGIGLSTCKCVDGGCKEMSVCGDGDCDPSYENPTNCPQDCGNTSACAKEGETAGHGVNDEPLCCPWLTKIVDEPRPDGRGGCGLTPAGFMICVKCGDGTCGKGENYCNCPGDCANSERDCVKEGERIRGNGENNGMKCCAGLTEVFDQWELDSAGKCLALDNYGYYCLNCGNGLCGAGENKCNCPQDCKGSEGQECDDPSDCVIAVDLGGCCACPKVLPKSKLDGKIFVAYEKGIDYSSMLPTECRNMVCSPCAPVGSAVCQSGKCVNAPVCGNSYCESGEDVKICPQDCGS